MNRNGPHRTLERASTGSSPRVLRVRLLGDVQVGHEGRPPATKLTRTVQTLLAYLLLNRHRSHAREVLAGLFWGDQPEENARGCLNTALWRLRRIIEPQGIPRGTYLINGVGGDVSFNRGSTYWLDVAVLEERAGQVLTRGPGDVREADVVALEEAVRLYTGDLLEGVYSDWVLRERERLRSLYLNSLCYLMRYHRGHGAYDKSLAWGREILAHDPLREEIHREMMRLYRDVGQRALALRQYEACRTVLAAELEIEPMEETRALHAELLGDSRQGPRTVRPSGSNTVAALVHAMRQAVEGLELIRGGLEKALALAEELDASSPEHPGATRAPKPGQ